MSHNSPDTSLRVFHSIAHYGLDISRAVLASGASLTPYLEAFHTDLYLSADEMDVQSAIDCGIAAGIICCDEIKAYSKEEEISQIRIAFDGDAVLFSDESERVFREKGLEAFEESERLQAEKPLRQGPFAKFLKTISDIQSEFPQEQAPIRTALVTARCAPAHERVIRTLRAWHVRIDEAFLGSCNNGRIDDLRAGAAIVKGRKVSDHVRFLVVPASQEVYLQALHEGLIDTFMKSGAIVMNPNCSVCWGSCQGVIGENEVLISTGTRNFKGRAGHPSSKVYLGSAATVAASAVKGEICTADMLDETRI